MLFYCQSTTIQSLKEEIQECQELQYVKNWQLASMKAELLKEQACSIAEDHVPPAHQDEQIQKIRHLGIAFSSSLSSS